MLLEPFRFGSHPKCCILVIINVSWTRSLCSVWPEPEMVYAIYNQCYLNSFVSFEPRVLYTSYNQCHLSPFVSFEPKMQCTSYNQCHLNSFVSLEPNVLYTICNQRHFNPSLCSNLKCCIQCVINIT